MKQFIPHLERLAHHAYALAGDRGLAAELKEFLRERHGVRIEGNPDLFDRAYATLAIDDARELKALHDTRPIEESGLKVFIITMDAATSEAQNALLKLLEEPGEYARFFLIIPSAHILLPTVKSRLRVIEIESQDDAGSGKRPFAAEAARFVTLPPAKRLDEVKKLVEDIAKEKRPKRDAIDFLDALEAVVYERNGARGGQAKLEAIAAARNYAGDRAPSLKMLLEQIALVL